MRHILVAAFALLLAPMASAQTAPPPVEAYGALPLFGDAAISPDGRHVAFANSADGRSVLRIINIDTGATVRGIGTEPTKLRGVGWADNERAVFYVSQTFRPNSGGLPAGVTFPGGARFIEYWRVGLLPLAGGEPRYIELEDESLSWAQVGLTRFTAPIDGDPGAGRMIAWAPRVGLLSVFRVDLARGTGQRSVSGGRATADIVLNDRGGIGASIEINERTNRWQLFYHDGENAPRSIMADVSQTGAGPNVEGFLEDGRMVVVDRLGDDQRSRFYALNTNDGSREALVEHATFDVEGAIRDPWTHRVVGAAWTEDFPKQQFFNADLAAIYQSLQTRFEGGYATIESWSQDKTRLVVLGETSSDGGIYYLYEPATNNLRALGQRYPALRGEAALGRRQAITYRARDGVRVPAYLTLPGGAEARGLPLVLLVHGGPHARDTFTFDWWASFLGSRGYAVLQPNYRGSTGYGAEWFEAGRGGWGDGVMQNDVVDGVDALVRAGIVDPSRVCIVGASYGGYAALAGATLTPDKFRCAVSVAGVSDLLLMLDRTAAQSGGGSSMASDWWRLSIGDRRGDREHLRAISPANRAADVRAPILLLHGEHDTVVPIEQSEIMVNRLRAAGKEVRFVEMPSDDHWLSNGETRTQMLREIEAFLAQHLSHGGSIDVDPDRQIPVSPGQ